MVSYYSLAAKFSMIFAHTQYLDDTVELENKWL
jgi:hypothetical protein